MDSDQVFDHRKFDGGTLQGGTAPTDTPTQESATQALYHELLFAVANKHPGETRHETALRYIRQAENPGTAQMQAQQAKPTNWAGS